MSRPIIEVSNVSKRYRLGAVNAATLRDELTGWWQRRRRGTAAPADSPRDFWALRDVSFSVQPGEVIGVVGHNGAGKSTLLKVLSRITEPTSGRAVLRGRVASLLEVGTGFHPDLTGRENIFLNGAILGMSRGEIRSKFDEIVAFAEVEQFIDTPVKRYSSGMYVRLAFAVAAHLDPEILIIDEVLAVGDAQFQQKCLGKMGAVARGGKTILFVSHSMGTVSKLCTGAILMSGGRVEATGRTDDIVGRYLNLGNVPDEQGTALHLQAPSHPFILHSAEVLNSAGEPSTLLSNTDPFRVRLTCQCTAAVRNLRVGFRLHAQDGTVVLSTTDCDNFQGRAHDRPTGKFVSEVEFPGHLLNKGRYYIWVGIDVPMVSAVLSVDKAASFTIAALGGAVADINDQRLGVIAPNLSWQIRAVS